MVQNRQRDTYEPKEEERILRGEKQIYFIKLQQRE